MKYRNYQECYELDVWEVKEFCLQVANEYRFTVLARRLLLAVDIMQMAKLINSQEVYQRKYFIALKRHLDLETENEKVLVLMKSLIDWDYPLYVKLRTNLITYLNQLSQNDYFTADIYCLLRHLYRQNAMQRKKMIEAMTKKENEMQNYFTCEIYLIEEDYQMAYTYLKACRFEGNLVPYGPFLYHYSPLKYRLYVKKQPLFKNMHWGESLWMRKQLKY